MHSFIAYASNPSDIGSTIEEAVKKINNNTSKVAFSTWASNDIAGRPLVDPIFEKVENSDFIVADVSVLNFNVIFEIGYAIGQNKRAVLIRNKNIVIDEQAIQKIGIFDTLGHQLYSDSDDLSIQA